MVKILVVDNDELLFKTLKHYLEARGFSILFFNSGIDAIENCKKNNYHAIFLNAIIPDMDGLDFIQKIQRFSASPIIVLIDDYRSLKGTMKLYLIKNSMDTICKPYYDEMYSSKVNCYSKNHYNMIKELLEKYIEELKNENIICYGGFFIDNDKRELQINGKSIDISKYEFEILFYLARNPHTVFSRNELFDVFSYKDSMEALVIDILIKRLKAKLEDVSNVCEIETVWGIGYKFNYLDL